MIKETRIHNGEMTVISINNVGNLDRNMQKIENRTTFLNHIQK